MPESSHNYYSRGVQGIGYDPQTITTTALSRVKFPKVFEAFDAAGTFTGNGDVDSRPVSTEIAAALNELIPPAPNLKWVGYSFSRDPDSGAGDRAGVLINVQWGYWNSKDEKELGGSYIVTDPAGIATSSKTVKIDGVPTVPAGHVLRTTLVSDLPGGHTQSTAEGGTQTTAQEIVNNDTHATRSVVEGDANVTATVFNSSSTAAQLANYYLPTLQNTANFSHLTARKINPNVAELVEHYRNQGIQIRFRGAAERRIYATVDSGAVHVYPIQNDAMAGTVRNVMLGSVRSSTAPFREITASIQTQGTQFPDHATLQGYTNSDTFLGLSPGTVAYVRAEGNTRYDVTGSKTLFVTWVFEWNPDGFIQDLPQSVFDTPLRVNTSNTNKDSWEAASDFGLTLSPASSVSFTSNFFS